MHIAVQLSNLSTILKKLSQQLIRCAEELDQHPDIADFFKLGKSASGLLA
jgi:hypothetical protein